MEKIAKIPKNYIENLHVENTPNYASNTHFGLGQLGLLGEPSGGQNVFSWLVQVFFWSREHFYPSKCLILVHYQFFCLGVGGGHIFNFLFHLFINTTQSERSHYPSPCYSLFVWSDIALISYFWLCRILLCKYIFCNKDSCATPTQLALPHNPLVRKDFLTVQT